jgi:cytochrome c oxidase subunit 2
MRMSKALFLALSLIASPAWADWQLNMNEGVTALSREIFDLHMLIFGFALPSV